MIYQTIPATDETSITVRFNKPVETWTADDQAVVIRRLAKYMRDHSKRAGKRRHRKKMTK
jgi:hypothetical protein